MPSTPQSSSWYTKVLHQQQQLERRRFNAPLQTIRGGNVNDTISTPNPITLDMNRARLRIESIHSYGIISALLLGSSLNLILKVTPTFKKIPVADQTSSIFPRMMVRFENWVNRAFLVTSSISAMASLYSALLFQLLAMYSRYALGMGMDDRFKVFLDKTETFRVTGFRMFMMSMFTFGVSLVICFFLIADEPLKYLTIVPLSMLVFLSCNIQRMRRIVDETLFSTEE